MTHTDDLKSLLVASLAGWGVNAVCDGRVVVVVGSKAAETWELKWRD